MKRTMSSSRVAYWVGDGLLASYGRSRLTAPYVDVWKNGKLEPNDRVVELYRELQANGFNARIIGLEMSHYFCD